MQEQIENRPGMISRAVAMIKAHLALFAGLSVVGVAFAIFVLAYFQPQKIFIDARVHEAPPTAPTTPMPGMGGTFKGLAHGASGRASVLDVAGGGKVLRFEDFDVSNGPDLFVYLSSVEPGASESAFPGEFLNISRLKGNVGDQNYSLPADVDLSRFRSVVIYCKRFSTAFAVAPLG